MTKIVKITADDGSAVQFIHENPKRGAMKDVYFSPDRSYVVAFYRDPQDSNSRSRLANIVGSYREKLFQGQAGAYWNELFCWPTKTVEHDGRVGVVVPAYSRKFFFKSGGEKSGKWFTSAKVRKKSLDPSERGDWRGYIAISIKIARAARRLHMAGLAHSDLSYNNVLVDPVSGSACIIDIDGLVVPGKYPPDVSGTRDFVAPEVVESDWLRLAKNDPKRALPRIETDRHALACLIYMYLLYRHPLRGRKMHDLKDEHRDDALRMGSGAVFIEHPTDASNRPGPDELKDDFLPWADPSLIPYTVTGRYLSPLFERAFTTGLHNPTARPTADAWELALVKTVDLLQRCQNTSCEQGWYVYDGTTSPRCPFCKTLHKGRLPVLNLYSSRGRGEFRPDDHRLIVYNDQHLYQWHVNRRIVPGERLTAEQKTPVGYFKEYRGAWYLCNQRLDGMYEVDGSGSKRHIPRKGKVELVDGKKILLANEDGGRLIQVQLVGA